MKKFFKIALVVIFSLIILDLALGFIFNLIVEHERVKNLELDGSTIVVSEDEYVNYVDELYINAEKYIGKEIVIEGFYDNDEYEKITYNFVGREIKSNETEEHDHSEECEHTHYVGLEFLYNGDLPEIGDFIRVSGKLAIVTDEQDAEMVYLALTDCNIEYDIPTGKRYVN